MPRHTGQLGEAAALVRRERKGGNVDKNLYCGLHRRAGLGLAGLDNFSGLWGIPVSLVVWYLALGDEGRGTVAESVRAP